jgi:hypothetical protein
MTTTYRVQYLGNSIGIAIITNNSLTIEVHWVILQNQTIQQQSITQILISSSSHYNWTYPIGISENTIIQDLLTRTIPNYVTNGQTNYSWTQI